MIVLTLGKIHGMNIVEEAVQIYFPAVKRVMPQASLRGPTQAA